MDDGSLDCTAEVARSLPGVIVLTIPNGGPATARNVGISAAGSEWIALLDADDWWLPGKLARQLEEAEPDVGLITTLSDRTPADVCPECVTVADLLRANPLVTSSALLRRKVWVNLGGFIEDRPLIGIEDYNLWIRIAAADWKIRCVQEILTHYTMGVGISMNLHRMLRGLLYNFELLEREGLDVAKRRVAILDKFARLGLWHRDMRLARKAAFRAHLADPTFHRQAILAASLMPAWALNAALWWRPALASGAITLEK